MPLLSCLHPDALTAFLRVVLFFIAITWHDLPSMYISVVCNAYSLALLSLARAAAAVVRRKRHRHRHASRGRNLDARQVPLQ